MEKLLKLRIQNEIVTFRTEDTDEYPTRCILWGHR